MSEALATALDGEISMVMRSSNLVAGCSLPFSEHSTRYAELLDVPSSCWRNKALAGFSSRTEFANSIPVSQQSVDPHLHMSNLPTSSVYGKFFDREVTVFALVI
jgi:hypothetical protein